MGLQHVNRFILYVSNRNSKKTQATDMFCSVCIPDSNMSHDCLHFCQLFGKKEPQSPREANLDSRLVSRLSGFNRTALRSCTVQHDARDQLWVIWKQQQQQQKKKQKKPRTTYPIHWQPPLQEHNTRRTEENQVKRTVSNSTSKSEIKDFPWSQ